jgi:hypothetical protein
MLCPNLLQAAIARVRQKSRGEPPRRAVGIGTELQCYEWTIALTFSRK